MLHTNFRKFGIKLFICFCTLLAVLRSKELGEIQVKILRFEAPSNVPTKRAQLNLTFDYHRTVKMVFEAPHNVASIQDFNENLPPQNFNVTLMNRIEALCVVTSSGSNASTSNTTRTSWLTSDWLTKPQVFNLTFEGGCKWKFQVNTICKQGGMYGISCNVSCTPKGRRVCSTMGKLQCKPEFQGENCDILKRCTERPCHNDATCDDSKGVTRCTCPETYEGVTCDVDVDECLFGNPCLNGGVCRNHIGGFHCKCRKQYSGPICGTRILLRSEAEKSLCLNGLPCSNGGTCISDAVGIKSCKCTINYKGTYCSVDVDECLSGPCKHGGTCINKNGTFTCKCIRQYSGKLCEFSLRKGGRPFNAYLPVLAVILVMCMTFITLYIVGSKRRWTEPLRDTRTKEERSKHERSKHERSKNDRSKNDRSKEELED